MIGSFYEITGRIFDEKGIIGIVEVYRSIGFLSIPARFAPERLSYKRLNSWTDLYILSLSRFCLRG
ncbi:MAG TPA: hypothetical protein PKC09_12005 [Paracoccus sp. (in: a-proteobacteria)]|uniref:hypothetical protein n=1 Tax=uncultured Paracoccus sp. TaxID=189685 RepID=UPI002603F8EB|nr:hypothetical protein [uncultured Paracoccus sp.]HMQ41983.1 hypothetical protein [Paracoccus sp. (in: a-proteobacteria)]HMR36986.1 hypothetical protein [Paracoccus sp. (in: a-proteobacteria)]